MTAWKSTGNGFCELYLAGKRILKAYAFAESADGRRVDTRTAELICERSKDGSLVFSYKGEEGLILDWCLEDESNKMSCAYCSLRSVDKTDVATRNLVPLIISEPSKEEGEAAPEIWKDLWIRMLQVPYDNTMWLRFEAVPLRAGRKSYELSVLYSEETGEGILIGALEFDCWKNAIVCSATDANTVEAISGAADEGTHDTQPHGILSGKEVKSAKFGIMYGADYRDLLEAYGDYLAESSPALKWKHGVPFGFNSWAGLASRLTGERYEKSGDFLRQELMPEGYQNDGTTYVNLDAFWNTIPEKQLMTIVDKFHAQGQRVGIYDAPFAFFGRNETKEIPGVKGHTFAEILQKDERGRFLPRVDGAIPCDVTHPLWKQMTEHKLKQFVDWGFDYVKLDFLSHGGMEGSHYDKSVNTGRQAINRGYKFINDCLDEGKIGRSFFISLSIAPIFPYGYGHARRVSCDAFGTAKDVEYELNSQTYGWWINGRLYQYNDPDHIVLLKSFGMEKESTLGEARARYTTAVIGGTVMMLSDDYERAKAMERARKLACNREVNRIAASQVSFRPMSSAQSTAAAAYSAKIDNKTYTAWFHWTEEKKSETLNVNGRYKDLWTGEIFEAEKGKLSWTVEGCDALLLEKI